MKPICVSCRLFFRPAKTGTYFTEGMPTPAGWRPYKIWAGDRWRCPGCGATIIVGCGAQPLAIQHEDRFDPLRHQLGADKLQIDDC